MSLSGLALGTERPNIVLIVADDVGYSDLGAFGGEIATPNLDALAFSGARFANFHAASSCAPTRAMLLTGVSSHSAGIGSMRELMPFAHRGEPGYEGVLNARVTTVARRLQDAGYRTAVAGKWHLGDEPRNLPPARGFDDSVIQADSGSDNFEMRPYLPMKPEAYWYDNGRRLESLPPDFYSSTFFTDRALQFLRAAEEPDRPFFLYLAYQANHTPLQAPSRFLDRYRGRYLEGWAEVRRARIDRLRKLGFLADTAQLAPGPTQAKWDALGKEEQYFEARRMQAYAGMATAMDHEVGRLLDYLRETGEFEDTVFIVLSDNGAVANEPYENPFGARWLRANYHRDVERLGEKGSWVAAGRHWGRVANTPLAGVKFSAGEGGVRVPLFIAGVPGLRPGAVYSDFAYVTDLAPTLLALAGVKETGLQAMTGVSLLPFLTGRAAGIHHADHAIGYEFSGSAALYRGEYKLVRNEPPHGDGAWRLFHLAQDPGETRDLGAEHPELFQSMRDDYAAWASEMGVLPMPENYSLTRQVTLNAALFVFLPRYTPYIAVFLLAVVLAGIVIRLRRQA
ncbi:MAG: arylsulfatase [Halioglobus sp.]|nr:arylsulfatase [Halioglobus sp.]